MFHIEGEEFTRQVFKIEKVPETIDERQKIQVILVIKFEIQEEKHGIGPFI